jgi:hypothetical protein
LVQSPSSLVPRRPIWPLAGELPATAPLGADASRLPPTARCCQPSICKGMARIRPSHQVKPPYISRPKPPPEFLHKSPCIF